MIGYQQAAGLLQGLRAQRRSYAAAAAGLQARYNALVATGSLQADPRQAACIQTLHKLSAELADYCRLAEAHTARAAEYEVRPTCMPYCWLCRPAAALCTDH